MTDSRLDPAGLDPAKQLPSVTAPGGLADGAGLVQQRQKVLVGGCGHGLQVLANMAQVSLAGLRRQSWVGCSACCHCCQYASEWVR